MAWNLPDGCTDADVDRAAPGYWDEPEGEDPDNEFPPVEMRDYGPCTSPTESEACPF